MPGALLRRIPLVLLPFIIIWIAAVLAHERHAELTDEQLHAPVDAIMPFSGYISPSKLSSGVSYSPWTWYLDLQTLQVFTQALLPISSQILH